MTTATPASPSPAPRRRLRVWQWILGGMAFCVVVVAATVVNAITLTREARTLRHEAFAALDVPASTQVQFSAGPLTFATVRTCAHFIDRLPPEARLALDAVRAVSVGVYRPRHDIGAAARTRMLVAAQAAMARRGWLPLVAVNDRKETVMVYSPADQDEGDPQRVCVLVCEPRQIVVVSATADPAPLVELARLKGGLALAE